MTREECLLKLLALEPETLDQIIVVTGWPADETGALLDRLVSEHKVGYGNGPHAAHGRRTYHTRMHALPDLQALGRAAHAAGNPKGEAGKVRAWPVLGVSAHARLVRTIRRGAAGRGAAAARMAGAPAC